MKDFFVVQHLSSDPLISGNSGFDLAPTVLPVSATPELDNHSFFSEIFYLIFSVTEGRAGGGRYNVTIF